MKEKVLIGACVALGLVVVAMGVKLYNTRNRLNSTREVS